MTSNSPSDAVPKLPVEHIFMNARQLAKALFGGTMASDDFTGEWTVYAVKKANKMLASRGVEPLIFSGRYSTTAKVTKWLEEHQGFMAGRVLRTSATAKAGTQGAKSEGRAQR